MVSASILIMVIHDTTAKRGHFPIQEDIWVSKLVQIETSGSEHTNRHYCCRPNPNPNPGHCLSILLVIWCTKTPGLMISSAVSMDARIIDRKTNHGDMGIISHRWWPLCPLSIKCNNEYLERHILG